MNDKRIIRLICVSLIICAVGVVYIVGKDIWLMARMNRAVTQANAEWDEAGGSVGEILKRAIRSENEVKKGRLEVVREREAQERKYRKMGADEKRKEEELLKTNLKVQANMNKKVVKGAINFALIGSSNSK
jgi:hypothetical protein